MGGGRAGRSGATRLQCGESGDTQKLDPTTFIYLYYHALYKDRTAIEQGHLLQQYRQLTE